MTWLTVRDKEILRAYADARMRVKTAARTLGVADTTVVYHLDRIGKETGQDPRDFWALAGLLGLRKEGRR